MHLFHLPLLVLDTKLFSLGTVYYIYTLYIICIYYRINHDSSWKQQQQQQQQHYQKLIPTIMNTILEAIEPPQSPLTLKST